jgi:hypothetical protein
LLTLGTDSLLKLLAASIDHTEIANRGTVTHAAIDGLLPAAYSHISLTNNPHSVTHAQVAPGIGYDHDAIDDFIESEQKFYSAWFAYTPVWKTYDVGGGQVDPDVGDNGVLYGRARRAGQNIEVHIELLWGSDTTGGTGAWAFTLPDNGAIPTPQVYEVDDSLFAASSNLYLGTGVALDATAGIYPLSVTTRQTNMDEITAFKELSGQSIRPGNPFSWANGDSLTLDLSYPVPGWGIV